MRFIIKLINVFYLSFRMSSKLIYLALFITIAASHPLPQRLTEQEFRAFKTDALNPDNNVDIFGGYAKVCLFYFFQH